MGEGAEDKKAKPAKQGSLDSSSSSGDERKDSSSDDMETSHDDTSKKKVSNIPLMYVLNSNVNF